MEKSSITIEGARSSVTLPISQWREIAARRNYGTSETPEQAARGRVLGMAAEAERMREEISAIDHYTERADIRHRARAVKLSTEAARLEQEAAQLMRKAKQLRTEEAEERAQARKEMAAVHTEYDGRRNVLRQRLTETQGWDIS